MFQCYWILQTGFLNIKHTLKISVLNDLLINVVMSELVRDMGPCKTCLNLDRKPERLLIVQFIPNDGRRVEPGDCQMFWTSILYYKQILSL